MALAPTDVGDNEYGPDIHLVTAHRTGDREAFDTIVRSHYPTLLACARRRLGNAADAEDAVQEAFLNAFRALDRFGDTGDWRLGAWLNTILSNVCKDVAAHRKPTVALDDWGTDAPLHSNVQDVAELAPDPVALEAVTRAISSLPSPRRRAFLLRMVDDLPYEEVAGEMGISEDNARAHVSRACKTLRVSLQGAGAISGTLAAAPLLLVHSFRSALRRVFSGSAGHSASVASAQQAISTGTPASTSTVAAITASPVSTSIQLLGQVAATPVAQAAIASSATSAGRGSIAFGLLAAVATASGLSIPVVTQQPAAQTPAIAAPASPSAAGGTSQSSTLSELGRMVPAGTSTPSAQTQAKSSSGSGTAASASGPPTQSKSTATLATAWLTLAESASVDGGTAPASASTTAPASASTTAPASASTAPASASTAPASASTTTATASGSAASTSAPVTSASATSSPAGGIGTGGGISGLSSALSSAHGFTLPIGSCTSVAGFPGVTRPTSVPALSSSVLDAILSTGSVPMTGTSASPSFAGTASVNATSGSSAPVHVKIGTCLAENGSILAVDMTTQTGDEWQLVGSLVSQPFSGSTTTAQKAESVDYLFRGAVTQIAGPTGASDGLPWILPPNFVAEVQVLEPSNTAELTVVFLGPLPAVTAPASTVASEGTTSSTTGSSESTTGSPSMGTGSSSAG